MSLVSLSGRVFFGGGILLACCGGSTFLCVCVHVYCFIGVTEQMSFLNECNYVINN